MFDPWAMAPVLSHRYSLHDVVCVTRRVDAPIDHVVRRLAELSGTDPTVAVGEYGATSGPSTTSARTASRTSAQPVRHHSAPLTAVPR